MSQPGSFKQFPEDRFLLNADEGLLKEVQNSIHPAFRFLFPHILIPTNLNS